MTTRDLEEESHRVPDVENADLSQEVASVEDRLRALVDEGRYEALLLGGAELVGWLSGYFRYGAGTGAALLRPGRPVTLLVPSFEMDRARELTSARDVEVRPSTAVGFGLLRDPGPGLELALRDLPDVAGITRWAVAGAPWLDGDPEWGEVVDVTSDVEQLRMVKDVAERRAIEATTRLCWAAQEAVAEALPGTVSEIDLFSLARLTGERLHGEPVDFFADVIAGAATSDVGAPTAVSGSRLVGSNEAVIVDLVFGAGGYYGDITWTHVRGENEAIAQLREGLVGVMESVAHELRPGRRCSAIHRALAEEIAEVAPGSTFAHHGGHGIGLAGYEAPFLTPWDDTELEEGMVLALEPGCYFSHTLGVRVERDYVVTARGGRELPGRPTSMGGRT